MKKSLYLSVALHLTVFLLLVAGLPLFATSVPIAPEDNILMVDLSQLKLAEVTNVPKKRIETKKKTEEKKKKQKKQKESKPLTVKSKAPNALEQKKQEKAEDVKLESEGEKKKKPETKKTKQNKQINDAVKNLLASVEKMKKEIKTEEELPPTKDDTHKGIEGGKIGNYIDDLTISEKDALSSKLRSCWNLDAGVKGIEDMIVEIRTSLRSDGSVAGVKIANTLRYASDSAFRSVAESARRAVFICDNLEEESPFVMLAKRHPEKYDLWREITLFFNPLAGTVNQSGK